MTEKEIDQKITELEAEKRKLRKQRRALKVKPFSTERAQEMRGRIEELRKRETALWDTLRRRCPHDWKVTKEYSDSDCDGLFGGWTHSRQCNICAKFESLPTEGLSRRW